MAKNPIKRVTIRDVAAMAEVSVTTVSHTLNCKGRIDKSTAERVRLAAKRLGYQASATARNLQGGRTGRIAIINSQSSPHEISLVDLDHFVRLLAGASEEASAQGLTTLLQLPEPNVENARLPVDGVILVDPVVDEKLLESMPEAGIPVVTTGREVSGTQRPQHWVDNDLNGATTQILDHLSEMGARRVAMIVSSKIYSYSQDALEAYRLWTSANNAPHFVGEVESTLSEGGAFDAALKLLDMPNPPDAIHCATDRFALGVSIAARSRGLRIPDDLMLSSGTESIAARRHVPPLTAIELNPEMIGSNACKMLISLIEGGKAQNEILVPHDLILRGSTRAG